MSKRPNVLMVCGRNKRRSRTAEYMFKNDMRFHIRSVGLSPKSERKITEKDVEGADLIMVMERAQRSRIQETYRHLDLPAIEVLEIEDEYEYLNETLMELLDERINAVLSLRYKI